MRLIAVATNVYTRICFISYNLFLGLFHRAILMSGSAMSDWAISNHPQQALMQVLQQLDCPLRDDNEEMLTCLRAKPYQDIMKVHVTTPEFTTSFGPVVDNFIVPNEPQKMMQHFHGGFKRFVFRQSMLPSFDTISISIYLVLFSFNDKI